MNETDTKPYKCLSFLDAKFSFVFFYNNNCVGILNMIGAYVYSRKYCTKLNYGNDYFFV